MHAADGDNIIGWQLLLGEEGLKFYSPTAPDHKNSFFKKKFQKEFRFFLTPLPQNTEMTHAFLAFTVGWKGKEGGRSCRRPSGCFRTMAKSQAANLTCQDSPLFVASYYAFSLSQTKGKDSF